MSSSTEVCLADTRRAASAIHMAQTVSPDSPIGRRLQHISSKIDELLAELRRYVRKEQAG